MMAALYGFGYMKAALAALQSLQAKQRKQVIAKIEALATNPFPVGHKLVRGMSDDEDKVYRIRAGDYRVLYIVHNPTITILDIGHRKDIYK